MGLALFAPVLERIQMLRIEARHAGEFFNWLFPSTHVGE